jgi:hypothetical protein
MFCQIYVIMWRFAKNMELCEVSSKIWNYVKFCRKYRIMGFGFRVYMGVPTKIRFFFLDFDVTYPPIFMCSEANGAIIPP